MLKDLVQSLTSVTSSRDSDVRLNERSYDRLTQADDPMASLASLRPKKVFRSGRKQKVFSPFNISSIVSESEPQNSEYHQPVRIIPNSMEREQERRETVRKNAKKPQR